VLTVETSHVTELIPTYVLGLLDSDEIRRVERHLDECAVCRAELQSYRQVGDQLALAAPLVAPPSALNQRLTSRIAALSTAAPPDTMAPVTIAPVTVPQATVPQATVPPPRLSVWQRLAALSRQAAPVWVPLSAVLILALFAATLWLWQARPTAPPDLTTVVLSGTEDAPAASGLLATTASGTTGVLVVQGLPPLSPEQQYQLWLVQDDQRTDGGVFSVDAQGYGYLEVWAPQPLVNYGRFGVTVEPAGGSPGPTGARVLGGSM
jgi:anti-sigma-K factor RskA